VVSSPTRLLLCEGAMDWDVKLLLVLAGSTLVLAAVSSVFFRWAENKAREKGLIDMQTHY